MNQAKIIIVMFDLLISFPLLIISKSLLDFLRGLDKFLLKKKDTPTFVSPIKFISINNINAS